MGPRSQFAFQHHVRHHPGGQLTIFDDGGGPTNVDTRSRGMKIALDLTSMEATFVHEYLLVPTFLTTSQGSVQVLDKRRHLRRMGAQPYWSEYAADGRLLFDAQLPKGGDSYRTFRFAWQGQPHQPPAILAQRSGRDQVTAYATWNGSTEVATWELMAQSEAGTLQRIASAPRFGFETAISVRTRSTRVAMAPRDATGKLLATSPSKEV